MLTAEHRKQSTHKHTAVLELKLIFKSSCETSCMWNVNRLSVEETGWHRAHGQCCQCRGADQEKEGKEDTSPQS